MTVAAFWIAGIGSQQSRETALQYYDKVLRGGLTGRLQAAERNHQLQSAHHNDGDVITWHSGIAKQAQPKNPQMGGVLLRTNGAARAPCFCF